MFINLHDVTTSENWSPNKYIDTEIQMKLGITRVQPARDEMENEIRHYVEYLNHNPQWVRRITNDINKLLVDREYIDFFMQIYMQWSSNNSIEYLPHFEKMALSQFNVYIEVETMTHCSVCDNCQK